jgi:hypothetical protein
MMPTHANEEMIWAHLAEVRRQARTGAVGRRPARAVLGELLVDLGLRLMGRPGATPATALRLPAPLGAGRPAPW